VPCFPPGAPGARLSPWLPVPRYSVSKVPFRAGRGVGVAGTWN
jgi:hypothetical protein